jgi:alpha-galactosidase
MEENSKTISPSSLTRRSFLGRSIGVAAVSATAGLPLKAQSKSDTNPASGTSSFFDVLRIPDSVTAFAGLNHPLPLSRSNSTWQAGGIEIYFHPTAIQMPISISAPGIEPTHIHLRWSAQASQSLRCLGDHWERSYGDLSWRGIVPERVMPWYFATHDGSACNCYGVKTAAGALCFWQVDQEGVSLWLNLSNGGKGVRLGDRQLRAATVVSRKGHAGEEPLSSIRSFCKIMCDKPRLPTAPTYGSNDWYYAYGKNSAQQTLRDVDLVAELSSTNIVRPFAVIDMGWENSPAFPDMAALAAEMKHRKIRPGIWIRPLLGSSSAHRELLITDARFGSQKERAAELAFDPTIPNALELAVAKVEQVVNWGFELVKHDFSTYDLLGRWGSEMGASPTLPGWSFHDRSRTNAEIILDLYRAIRKAAGEQTLILGCNTVGHLSAGLFELQRTGDDTSGEHWERTRKMGVNTLAFRLAQHRTFFVLDADCVGITKAIPWDQNRQWLDLLARSGTALFISPSPDATGPDQKKAIAEAFAIAAKGESNLIPIDELDSTTPEHWKNYDSVDQEIRYQWCTSSGADPFAS